MKPNPKFLPPPRQARILLILGLVAILLSPLLREGLAGVALGVGGVLFVLGLLGNGFAALLGQKGEPKAPDEDRGT